MAGYAGSWWDIMVRYTGSRWDTLDHGGIRWLVMRVQEQEAWQTVVKHFIT